MKKFNSLKEITVNDLDTIRLGRAADFGIVEVKPDSLFLVFLVDRDDSPQCPGFPAMAVEYFTNMETAKKAIKDLLKKLKYEKAKIHIFSTRRK